ncbi:hypothetical protein C2E23DRAFT_262409 [Lenzites betulinus]|nr:hypothetical protein C2E23DRAFT_262409 [Lenzites betulinus]
MLYKSRTRSDEFVYIGALLVHIDLTMQPYVYPDLGSPPYISTIGTVVLGGVMGLMLYGLTLHQTYRYYRLGPPDSISMKVFVRPTPCHIGGHVLPESNCDDKVFAIFCLETFHVALWLMTGYHYLVVDPFITGSLAHGHWFVRLIVPVTALTVALTQCFYLRRIYLIGSMYRRLAAPAGLGLAISQGFAIAAGIYAFKLTPAIVDFQHISWLFSVAYGFVGITDILLAATLVYVLRRSRTGTRRADSMLDTLIIYTINTGVLTR